MPIYLTEFGVNSKPNKFEGVSAAKQAEYDAIAEHMAYDNPRVAAFSQYLLKDDPIGGPFSASAIGGFVGFQTGLEYVSGEHKPLYNGFPVPLTVTKRGHGFSLWGLVRPTTGVTKATVLVKLQGRAQLPHAEDGHDQRRRLLVLQLVDQGRLLARALGQPGRRQIRRPADRRLLIASPRPPRPVTRRMPAEGESRGFSDSF